MTARLTEQLVARLVRSPRDMDVRDSRCRGLILRCRASGKHTYRFQVRRGRWTTIGRLDEFSLEEARSEADSLRGDVARGKDPVAEKRRTYAASLQVFLEHEYGPWVTAHRKTGAETVERIETTFREFLTVPLQDINLARVERWRSTRLAKGRTPATVNRDIASLRSVLSRALEWGVLATHPLAKLKAAKVDAVGVVRYLSQDEERRLRTTMAERDERRRAARLQANAWRRDRKYQELEAFGTYTDHLTPLVLLALNTGLRRGELLALRWEDLDFARAILTVRAANAKGAQTRHLRSWSWPASI
jgi:integrase